MSARVLVVDDDPAVCSLLEALLSREAIACETVGDGDAAVLRLRQQTYDAILLDLMLPGTWGFDIIRFLQAERPAMARRVIVVTAASNLTLRDFDTSAVYALLRKPFDIEALIATVRGCLSLGALRLDGT
jgi:DNA-binding response OmpR family regulator